MKKSDLKTGMLLTTREGEVGIVMLNNTYGEDALVFSENSWTGLSGFTEDLMWISSNETLENRIDFCKTVDIIKVEAPDLPTGFISRKSKWGGLKILWERTDIPNFTIKQLEVMVGKFNLIK
jgi:hypothetical protein